MEKKSNGLSVGGLVLGIISLVMAVFGALFLGIFGYIIAILTGIVGIILSVMGKKKQPSGAATAGFVLSLIGLILGALFFLACAICAGALFAAAGAI